MKKKLPLSIYNKLIYVSTGSVFISSILLSKVYAQQAGVDTPDTPENGSNPTRVESTRFENPLVADNITELLMAFLRIVMIVAVPIIVFFIVYAGFLYVTARGNTDQVKTATQALTYAIIGGVIVIAAVAITDIVANLVGAFQSGD